MTFATWPAPAREIAGRSIPSQVACRRLGRAPVGIVLASVGSDGTTGSNSTSKLLWCGSKCCASTNAIPVSEGVWRRKVLKAARPPAEAPMPTTRNAGFTHAVSSRECVKHGRGQMVSKVSCTLPSSHLLVSVDKKVVKGFDVNQAETRKFHVGNNIQGNGQSGSKHHHMNPAASFCGSHTKARK